jgi:hypothetical protein
MKNPSLTPRRHHDDGLPLFCFVLLASNNDRSHEISPDSHASALRRRVASATSFASVGLKRPSSEWPSPILHARRFLS